MKLSIERLCLVAILLSMLTLTSGCTQLAMFTMLRTGNPVRLETTSAIPFELVGHKILVPIRINGGEREFTFFLDTCGPTIIDLSVAGELHLEKGREIPLNDDSKAFLTDKKADISLGDAQVEDLRLLMMDMGIFQKSAGRSIHGIVGSNFLRHFRVTFDYRAKQLVLEQSSAEKSSSAKQVYLGNSPPDAESGTGVVLLGNGGYTIPCSKRFPLHWPTVQCRLDGDITAEALLDTGSPYAIAAPVSLIEKQDFTQERPLLESEGIFVKWPGAYADSLERNYLARLDSFQIGDLQITNLPVIYANTGSILLGKGFLSRYVVTIDYPAEELTLLPYSDTNFDRNLFSTGLRLKSEKPGRTVVKGFWKGSPADREGLRPGDEVLSINSTATGDLTDREISRLLNDDAITVIDLVVKEGDSARRVSLKKEMLLPEVAE
jgi:hypothetical protein